MLRSLTGCSLALLCTLAVVAQEPKWDSTYRPDIYSPKVAMFRSFGHTKKDIVFLGNSITFWGEWGELLRMDHIRNRGIPGDMTFGVLERLDEVTGGQPSKVFILIGINDIAREVPDSVILHNYERIIERIRRESPRTKIFFQTLLPTNASFNKLMAYYHQEEHIMKINAGLKSIAAAQNIVLIDLYAAFADKDGSLPKQYTFDGVHLTKEGYDKWVALLKRGKYLK